MVVENHELCRAAGEETLARGRDVGLERGFPVSQYSGMQPKVSRTLRSWDAPSMSTLTATSIRRILERAEHAVRSTFDTEAARCRVFRGGLDERDVLRRTANRVERVATLDA